MRQERIEQLLEIVDRAYDRRSWHGTNLRGAIRGVTAEQAARRPAPGRHNIWELVVHAAYWKYAVRRRLTGERRGSFGLVGSNWFERPVVGAASPSSWKEDLTLLATSHRQLREAIARLDDSGLARTEPGSKATNFELIAGIAAHDLYHAGQIQLIKRLNNA